ncbi:MAG TPA: GNAT family N-acetyltransferase [Desulfuromonadaceae bacterium]|nr:GNAT family N-acetyltransferase [Desulfuromonadaceae bacterium]
MENPAFTIRRATENDAAAIAGLAATLGYQVDITAMAKRLKAILGSAADLVLVAEKAMAPIGWLQAHAAHVVESGFRVEIMGLVVAPEQRRGGAGRRLMAEAERWAHGIGAQAVVVRSNVQRVESHAFYPALGYTPTKTQNVYRKNL